MSAWPGRIAFALSILLLPAGGGAAPGAQGEPLAGADSLEQRLRALRSAGRYALAAEVAAANLKALRTAPTSPAWKVRDAELTLETLQYAAGLSEAAQRSLAEADSLTPVLQDLANGRECETGETAAKQQLEILTRILGREHPETAESLHSLGIFAYCKGDYKNAEKLTSEAIALLRTALGDQNPVIGTVACDLAAIMQARGRNSTADSLYRQALAVHRAALGEEDPQVLTDLHNLGFLLYSQGEYLAAEALLRRVVARRRVLLDPKDVLLGQSIGTLGSILAERGDVAEAEPLYREALGIFESTYGLENTNTSIALSDLASLLHDEGDYSGADRLLERVQAIDLKLLGEQHPEYAKTLQNRAETLVQLRKLPEGEALLRRALDIYRASFGADSAPVALILHNLGHCLFEQGRNAEAEATFRQALALRRRWLGGEHPHVLLTAQHLAATLHREGKDAAAESVLRQAAQIFETARLRAGRGSSRATFERSPYPELAAVELALDKRVQAWPAAEKGLGRVLGDLLLAADRRSLTRQESAREDSLLRVLSGLEDQLAAYQTAGTEDRAGNQSRRIRETCNQLAAVEADFSAFERDLVAKYSVQEGGVYGLARIQAALGPDAAILGWVEDSAANSDSLARGWAYVIRKTGPVRWAKLERRLSGSEGSSGKSYRNALNDDPEAPGAAERVATLSRRFYSTRVGPVEPFLSGVRELIVIPSQGMLGVPLEPVLDAQDRYLGDRFQIQYSPSATVHAWLVEKSPAASRELRALVVADPPFNDAQVAEMSREPEADPKGAAVEGSRSRPGQWGGTPAIARVLRSGNRGALAKLPRLRSSRAEADAFRQLFGSSAETLVGPQASEQSLVEKARSIGSFSILHFSTHAIVDDRQPDNCALILSQVGLPDAFEAAEHNRRIYDGRWTAKEVLQEWKLDADLVVLSGCETALGRKVAGEGYLGFAQAFLQAGARNLIVSLWQVDDSSTAMLMRRFYEHLVGPEDAKRGARSAARLSGRRIADALAQAKRDVREYSNAGSHPYAHPWYWAGFVLIGASE